jgi:uncharacterized membrane protein
MDKLLDVHHTLSQLAELHVKPNLFYLHQLVHHLALVDTQLLGTMIFILVVKFITLTLMLLISKLKS